MTVTAHGAPVTGTDRVRSWYRDTVSCLQSTVAALIDRSGADPLEELGLGWEFLYIPGDMRPEEYYWPCRRPGDLVRSLLPHHPGATSRWRPLGAGPDPFDGLRTALAEGRLPIVAVDNYHLPFRPAYRDVHAAHLVVVCAIDDAAGTAWVSDAMPPAHQGELALADLAAAAGSTLEDDFQDAFFTGGGTASGRWLDVRLDPVPRRLDPERLRHALQGNLRRFAEPAAVPDDGSEPFGWAGLDGLDRYLTGLVASAETGNGRALAECYTFGWGAQAAASLHGELLRRCGARWSLPELAEAGRRVEAVAHAWTPVRVACAHGRDAPRAAGRVLKPSAARLRRAYAVAVEAVGGTIAALESTRPSPTDSLETLP